MITFALRNIYITVQLRTQLVLALHHLFPLFFDKSIFFQINLASSFYYLVGPYYTGPKLIPALLTPALTGASFQMFTVIDKHIMPALLTPHHEK